MTSEQQQAWLVQWRYAARELIRIQQEELAQMTDAEGLQVMDRVLRPMGIAYHDPYRRTSSGLIEQQRLFLKARKS